MGDNQQSGDKLAGQHSQGMINRPANVVNQRFGDEIERATTAGANVHIYQQDRSLPRAALTPEDSMNARELSQIDRQFSEFSAALRENSKSQNETGKELMAVRSELVAVRGELALVKLELRNEISLIRQQMSAPAPQLSFSSEQMRQIFIAITIAAIFFCAVVIFVANGGAALP